MPVYAVVPTSTIDLSLASGDEIPIEFRGKEEVVRVDGSAVAPTESEVFNPAFDVTPNRYITAIITEKGVCYPPFAESLKRVVMSLLVCFKVLIILRKYTILDSLIYSYYSVCVMTIQIGLASMMQPFEFSMSTKEKLLIRNGQLY